MIVSHGTYKEALDKCIRASVIGFDTETTGLSPFRGDRLFSLIVYCGAIDEAFYFNFKDYGPGYEDYYLKFITEDIQSIFDKKDLCFAHNAKFDLHMLANEGVSIPGDVHDTLAVARLVYNEHPSYDLDSCVKRDLGEHKDDKVKQYILDHKFWEWEKKPGAKTKKKNLHFDKVPLEIIGPYGEKDAKLTYQLGQWQIEKLDELTKTTVTYSRTVKDLYALELALTKTLVRSEKEGLVLDKNYTHKALSAQYELIQKARDTFEYRAGMPLVDSGKGLREAFEKAGETISYTEKGNPTFKDEVISKYNTPLVEALQNFRNADKKAGTYYSTFLYVLGEDDRIHTELKQSGTKTGRFSSANPNLQNLNKEKIGDAEYLVRQCFIPPPNHCLFMPDMDQMEYRLMLDYANEQGIIKKILHQGLDVHTATAQMARITRDEAKTLNFALLYGAGPERVAMMLKITVRQAKKLIEDYFINLPAIDNWIRNVKRTAKNRGYLVSWYGRIFYYPFKGMSYKGPNSIIQGGCADIMKLAMVQIDKFLIENRCKSQMPLQIHDELLFHIHKSELDICPEIVKIMESVYPYKHVPLTAGPAHSWVSWAHKEEGYPVAQETRNQIQGSSAAGS